MAPAMEENPYQSPTSADREPPSPARPRPAGDAFERALKFGVVAQLIFLLFTTQIDPGTVGVAYLYTTIGYYLGVASIMLRRRTTPTSTDLLFLKWSPLAFLVVAFFGAVLVYQLRGY
jgi:hypothetical protein